AQFARMLHAAIANERASPIHVRLLGAKAVAKITNALSQPGDQALRAWAVGGGVDGRKSRVRRVNERRVHHGCIFIQRELQDYDTKGGTTYAFGLSRTCGRSHGFAASPCGYFQLVAVVVPIGYTCPWFQRISGRRFIGIRWGY